MKSQTFKLKQLDSLNEKSVMNLLIALNQIHNIIELKVDLDNKFILLRHCDSNVSREMLTDLIEKSIKTEDALA